MQFVYIQSPQQTSTTALNKNNLFIYIAQIILYWFISFGIVRLIKKFKTFSVFADSLMQTRGEVWEKSRAGV